MSDTIKKTCQRPERALWRAWRLEVSHRSGPRPGLLLALAALSPPLLALIALQFSWAAEQVSDHQLLVAILCSIAVSTWVHGERQKWTALYSRGWVATLPVSRRAVTAIVALRSHVWPLFLLAAAAWLTLWIALFSHPLTRSLTSILVACVLGTAAGSLLGWWLPRRRAVLWRPTSNYALPPLAKSVPTLSGLSRWPLSQVRIWLQPRSMSRLLLPVVLAFPLNISGNVAVAVLAVFITGLYLAVLLRATIRVAQESAEWLRSTPLSLPQFAGAVMRDATLKQLKWTALGGVFVIVSGTDAALTLRIAETWLGVVTVVSSLATTHAYCSRTMRLKIVISLAGLAAVENFKQYLALPCALLFSAWLFSRMRRA